MGETLCEALIPLQPEQTINAVAARRMTNLRFKFTSSGL
jgi:hypothetical protein